MGVVFRARQLALDRPVALKAIAPHLAQDENFRVRFQRESRIAASIDHPNVIPVYEAGELEGALYLIMRWVEGTDLRTLIASAGRLAPDRAIELLAPVASALAVGHRRGLIHRDVKPANVLIADGGGDPDHVYLTDFGIARELDADTVATRTGVLVGTLDYTAPERIEGAQGDAASDIYAFGCMLYETLTGTVPFDRPTELAKMHAHLNDPAPSARGIAPAVPVLLDAVIARAMAKPPGERFADAGELATAMQRALEAARSGEIEFATRLTRSQTETDETVLPSVEGRAPVAAATGQTARLAPAPAGAERSRRLLAVAAVAAVALAAVIVVLLAGGGGAAKHPGGGGAAKHGGGRPAAPLGSASAFATGSARVQLSLPLPPPRGRPAGLAVDGSELWVADPAHARIVGLIPGRPPQTVAVGGRPDALATDPRGRVWVTNASTTRVTVFDHSAGRPEQLPVGSETGGIAISHHAVWVASRGLSSVTRIDLASLSHTTIALSARPTAIVAASGRIWVALDDDSVAVLNDDGSPSRVAFAPLPGAAVAGAASDGIWFLTAIAGGTAKLTRINPNIPLAHVANGRLQYAEPAGQPSLAGRPADLVAGQHMLAVGFSDRLSLIGTSGGQDGRTLGTVRFGSDVGRLALSSAVVWAGLPPSGRVFEIAF
jgi:tRNA A-37 threonylcarbamoyl transferase component Bud32